MAVLRTKYVSVSIELEILLLLLLLRFHLLIDSEGRWVGTHQQRGNLVEDVDGLLRGLLFFGAVVWAGHFEENLCLWYLDLVGDLGCGLFWWFCLFQCGGGDVV